MTACGKKLHRSEGLTALNFVLTVQSVAEGKIPKKIPTPLRRLSAIPAGPTHTTPASSQWWCSNLTDWAQGFVCLKPLTYFYSHCRSQSLYCVIAELMLHVYSKTGRNCLAKKIAGGEALEMYVRWYRFFFIWPSKMHFVLKTGPEWCVRYYQVV